MDKFKLAIWVLVIAGSILGPYLKRRKERMEALKRTSDSPAPASAENAEEPDAEEGPTLPYEDLAEEVFGPYISRRRKAARRQPPPPPDAPPAPSRASAPTFRPAAEPSQAEVSAPIGVTPSRAAPGAEPHPAGGSVQADAARRPSLEEHLFGRRRLSSSAKLIIAAEILSPPRVLRARGRSQSR